MGKHVYGLTSDFYRIITGVFFFFEDLYKIEKDNFIWLDILKESLPDSGGKHDCVPPVSQLSLF